MIIDFHDVSITPNKVLGNVARWIILPVPGNYTSISSYWITVQKQGPARSGGGVG